MRPTNLSHACKVYDEGMFNKNESFESKNKVERLCHCHRKMNFKQNASAYVDFEASEIEC